MVEEELQEVEELEPEPRTPAPVKVREYYIKTFDVMFVSLGLILLAFFIALNAMAVLDDTKTREAIGSLTGEFGMLPDGIGVHETGSFITAPEEIHLDQEMLVFQDFSHFLEAEDVSPDEVEVVVDEDGRRRIRFSEHVLYSSGSMSFSPKVMPVLDRLGLILAKLGRSVEIEGHTDRTKGSQSNWHLSAMRAASVSRYLERTSSLSSDKISAIGYGATRPRFGRSDDQRNRRVEIVIN